MMTQHTEALLQGLDSELVVPIPANDFKAADAVNIPVESELGRAAHGERGTRPGQVGPKSLAMPVLACA